jgi:hypothetical protein
MKVLIATCLLLIAVSPLSAQMAVSHSTTTAATQSQTVTPQTMGKPVARVNGSVLTDRDLAREMYTIFPYARQHNGGFPQAMEADIRKGALKMIVFEELVYQEAVRRKVTVPPARMTKAMADFRGQFKSPDDYKAFMQVEVHGSQQLLRARIRRSLLIDQMLKTEVTDNSVVSVAEAKAYFDKNPDKFRIPESFAFQTISILPPEKPTPALLQEEKKRADDALRQAKATKNYEEFGLLAEKISEDDWRVMMGDHKAVPRMKLAPEILSVASKMQPGDVSELVLLQQAFTIIRLNAHIPAGMMKFADVKDGIREDLKKNKRDQLRAGLNKRLSKNAKVEEL